MCDNPSHGFSAEFGRRQSLKNARDCAVYRLPRFRGWVAENSMRQNVPRLVRKAVSRSETMRIAEKVNRLAVQLETVKRASLISKPKPISIHAPIASRNDVRRQLVFDEGDAVAQLQLALLQALDLDDVAARRFLQRSNRGIEVAMLLQKARKLRPKLAFFLFRHFRLGRALVAATLRLEHGFKSISYVGLSRFG